MTPTLIISSLTTNASWATLLICAVCMFAFISGGILVHFIHRGRCCYWNTKLIENSQTTTTEIGHEGIQYGADNEAGHTPLEYGTDDFQFGINNNCHAATTIPESKPIHSMVMFTPSTATTFHTIVRKIMNYSRSGDAMNISSCSSISSYDDDFDRFGPIDRNITYLSDARVQLDFDTPNSFSQLHSDPLSGSHTDVSSPETTHNTASSSILQFSRLFSSQDVAIMDQNSFSTNTDYTTEENIIDCNDTFKDDCQISTKESKADIYMKRLTISTVRAKCQSIMKGGISCSPLPMIDDETDISSTTDVCITVDDKCNTYTSSREQSSFV